MKEVKSQASKGAAQASRAVSTPKSSRESATSSGPCTTMSCVRGSRTALRSLSGNLTSQTPTPKWKALANQKTGGANASHRSLT